MRAFIRHRSDMPVQILRDNSAVLEFQRLKNVGMGGIGCTSPIPIDIGLRVKIFIPLIEPAFEGRIIWCEPAAGGYDVGIQFIEADPIAKLRLFEQAVRSKRYEQETPG